ncbi:phage major capsid protein [Clostridium botulinum]|uniref:phage major capsid protein n=1 Tax=Clostridium botulinum TaxID=1491 RepID=UPI000A170A13|nr:phage major capsid protein [Clostridium botulinum]MBY6799537.1 phage major capsid protein [Clostridium botulinum]NFF20885.1 phage major capsid protein [Clostridium botulinum]NFM75505.1 phage major capsid protein [Clostridium botulinum]NFP81057.1 phage major capsid protein [Clostridium botulinum]NFP94029.1 phage major capsid protein [Clostridium botulinum]
MKLSDELKQELEQLQNEAKQLMNKDGVTAEEITNKSKDIDTLKAKIKMQEKIEEEERQEIEDKINAGIAKELGKDGSMEETKNKQELYKEGFYNALRGKRVTEEQATVLKEFNNALSSNTGEDGGYTIPVDQQTAIKELKREFKSLETLVNIEPVTTPKGNRNIEKDAEYTPFAEFEEGEDVPTTDSPQFVNISYVIKDRGGILPVPNNLLADNTANLASYLNRWLAKKQIATRNKLIVDLLTTKAKTAIANVDDLKTITNITLDPTISAMSVVVTNQTGFNWLDTLKDSEGNYLLQKDPTMPTRKLLFGIHPVEVFSNKTLKNDTTSGTKAPIIIGSLKEAITLFDREAMSLLSTNIGGDAFKKNRTDIRAITREDIKLVDSDAFVYGQVAIA